jgi:hypothetical protein
MYALQPNPHQPRVRRVRPGYLPGQVIAAQQQSHASIALESGIKLGVNVLLSVAAIAALVQLVPYRTAQEVKLQELQAALKSSQDRASLAQNNFARVFDPSQAKQIGAEQTNQLPANQQEVLLFEPPNFNEGMQAKVNR